MMTMLTTSKWKKQQQKRANGKRVFVMSSWMRGKKEWLHPDSVF